MAKLNARTISLIIWGASAILFLIALGVFYSLNVKAEDLRKTNAEIRNQIRASQLEVAKISSDRDALASNLILLKNIQLSYNDYIGRTRRMLQLGCPRDRQRQCNRYLHYGDLLAFHSTTLTDRVSAVSRSDYEALLQRYRQTEPFIELVEWATNQERTGWTAIALEGQAYALLKLGAVDQAKPIIRRALGLQGGSPIIFTTSLKIRCAGKEDALAIKASYRQYQAQMRKRLEGLQSPKNDDQRKSTRINTDLLSGDTELTRICQYVGLNIDQ